MAHGQRAAQHSNNRREYWGRRPYSMVTRGKISKIITHRKERSIERTEIHRILSNQIDL